METSIGNQQTAFEADKLAAGDDRERAAQELTDARNAKLIDEASVTAI
jgi:hypothetical protein